MPRKKGSDYIAETGSQEAREKLASGLTQNPLSGLAKKVGGLFGGRSAAEGLDQSGVDNVERLNAQRRKGRD